LRVEASVIEPGLDLVDDCGDSLEVARAHVAHEQHGESSVGLVELAERLGGEPQLAQVPILSAMTTSG